MSTPDPTSPDPTSPDPSLAGAGLSATGTTAGDMKPGDDALGTTYGAPGGAGNDTLESTGSEQESGATADGDVEGA